MGEVCAELKIARSRWEKWRQKERLPEPFGYRTGNFGSAGEWLEQWIEDRLSVNAYG